jgi:hypothetical protein
MSPNPLPRNTFLEVYEMADGILSINQGEGSNRVVQQFTILKYEVLSDNANR